MRMSTNNFHISDLKKDFVVNNEYFNATLKDGDFSLNINNDLDLSLIVDISTPINFTLNVSRDTSLKLGLIGEEHIKKFDFVGNIDENSELNLYFADFSNKNTDFDFLLNLNGKAAKGVLKVASLSSGKDIKKYSFLINHKNKETYGLTDSYGVAKDDSFLSFIGNGHIYKGMTDSKAQQNCRIMVFDENAKGVVKPTLQIDDNDIAAGHLAILGKINPDQMFYMTSRGLTEKMAKELITRGYLNPILNGFDEQETKNKISNLIEEKML